MATILWWLKLSIGLFVGFVATLVFSMARRQLKVTYVAVVLFFASLATGAYTGWLFMDKSYRAVMDMGRPRTGAEIYQGLFGAPATDCVQVIRFRDQVVPKIDTDIRLHFRTCPAELKRILSQVSYTAGLEPNLPGKYITDDPDWPALPGDSIRVFFYDAGNGRRYQYLYATPDSTEVFYLDILD